MDIGPVGTKYEVIKGGMVDPFRDKSGAKMKPGEIWDLVPSTLGGPCLRKLNKNGSSTRLLNGVCFAACMMDEGRARILAADDPKAVAHDEMERGLKAKWEAEKKAHTANTDLTGSKQPEKGMP